MSLKNFQETKFLPISKRLFHLIGKCKNFFSNFKIRKKTNLQKIPLMGPLT